MPDKPHGKLSRRESQIMDALYRRGGASVAEVLEDLEDAPGYSAVRTILGVLEEKGCVRHWKEGRRFIYLPIVPPRTARRTALKHVLSTFFNDSMENAVVALLEMRSSGITPEEHDRLRKLIDDARKGGRR